MADRILSTHHSLSGRNTASRNPSTVSSSSDPSAPTLPGPSQEPQLDGLASLSRTLLGLSSPVDLSSATNVGASQEAVDGLRRDGDLSKDQPPLGSLQSSIPLPERSHGIQEVRSDMDTRRLPQVEKDTDDLTSPPSSSRRRMNRRESTTLTTLSRLFAVQTATSPLNSRHTSYTRPSNRRPPVQSRNPNVLETLELPDHLYHRGLLGGKHSDITVHAFGQQYRLHRIILDRAPFFASALSEPWLEANATDMAVHPEDIDESITQASFELALKRLYGCSSPAEEDADPVGLFATGCWLEMQDMVDSSTESMLRQMTLETLAPLITLVTNNYYGQAGEKILASATSMLCRDGWRMQLRFWDSIPGDIVREIIGADGFFVDGEWDRWVLAKRILERRMRLQAATLHLLDPTDRRRIRQPPYGIDLVSVRNDPLGHIKHIAYVNDDVQSWKSLYTNPDIEPILALLDEDIHYMHLPFEQLQYIKEAKDCLGLPLVSDTVVGKALWQQMELRQKIVNAKETDLEIGLTVETPAAAVLQATSASETPLASLSDTKDSKGKAKLGPKDSILDSRPRDGTDFPKLYLIPSSDCSTVMGGNPDPTPSFSARIPTRSSYGMPDFFQVQTESLADRIVTSTSQPRKPVRWASDASREGQESPLVSCTQFPPFRFSAEFPNPRFLKDRNRVYSRTVFYAGSLWNMYIRKMSSSRSKQLGVYLHRAKELEGEEATAGTAGLGQGSVDERIGQLEREMILRSERRDQRQRQRPTERTGHRRVEDEGSSGSGAEQEDDRVMHHHGNPKRTSTLRSLISGAPRKTVQAAETGTAASASNDRPSINIEDLFHATSACESEESEVEDTATISEKYHVATMPPYVDARPTIKTYFKIYSPSRGGRMLSVYESAPDKFNFSQSWGWKSNTLMIDEGLVGEEMDEQSTKDDTANEFERDVSGRKSDGKLRFMVVIGNV